MEEKEIEKNDVSRSEGKGKEDEGYEKVCYMCRRPESKTGPMISMPGGTICKIKCSTFFIFNIFF